MSNSPDRIFTAEVWQRDEWAKSHFPDMEPTINIMTEDPEDGSLDQWLLSVAEAKRLRTLLGRAIKLAEAGRAYPKE